MARNKYPEETVNLILAVSKKLFLEKGYERTSIQDIINGMGGLTKGAIYHHFKSKEEILLAIGEEIGQKNGMLFAEIRKDKTKNGMEKLKTVFLDAISRPKQDILIMAAPMMLENPSFLAMEIKNIFEYSVPVCLEPIIEEGIEDGSIKCSNPKEMSEALLVLTNVWLNPMVHVGDEEQSRKRVQTFGKLLEGMNIFMIDDEIEERYVKFCQRYRETKEKQLPK